MTTATMATGTRTTETTRTAETELRAAARRRGVTMKELAAMMGVSAGYLSQFANGGRPWTPKMRQKVAAVLGEVPGQGTVYRQGGAVTGESSFIRERAREMGMTMKDLADRAGVSYGYMSEVARGRKSTWASRSRPGSSRRSRPRPRSRPHSAPTARRAW